MKYITDNMLNGLAEELPKSNIQCETAVYAIRKDNDSSKTMKDAEIFRFLLEKRYELRERPKDETHEVKLITERQRSSSILRGIRSAKPICKRTREERFRRNRPRIS